MKRIGQMGNMFYEYDDEQSAKDIVDSKTVVPGEGLYGGPVCTEKDGYMEINGERCTIAEFTRMFDICCGRESVYAVSRIECFGGKDIYPITPLANESLEDRVCRAKRLIEDYEQDLLDAVEKDVEEKEERQQREGYLEAECPIGKQEWGKDPVMEKLVLQGLPSLTDISRHRIIGVREEEPLYSYEQTYRVTEYAPYPIKATLGGKAVEGACMLLEHKTECPENPVEEADYKHVWSMGISIPGYIEWKTLAVEGSDLEYRGEDPDYGNRVAYDETMSALRCVIRDNHVFALDGSCHG